VGVETDELRRILLLLFSGEIYFAKWSVFGDDFHYTKGDLLDFKFPFNELVTSDKKKLLALSAEWSKRAGSTLQYKLNAGKYVGTYNTSKLWDITDESDLIFLKYLCDDPVAVQEDLKLFVAQMAVALKRNSGNDNCG